MSETERKITNTQGRYMLAVSDGQDVPEADWTQCRILLTTERLVLIADEKEVVDLETVDRLGERYDLNHAARTESDYLTLHVGGDVLLVTTGDPEAFRTAFYRAILDGAVVNVKHPAVVGGVVQDATFQPGRLTVSEAAVRLALEDGQEFAIDRDDIGELSTDEAVVAEEERHVIEVEHTDEEGRSVETALYGREHHVSVLERLLEEGAERNRTNLNLDPIERRVVVALYSGVSPFGISEFVGVDVDRVAEIYDRLLELDVIEVERERTEVKLTAQGRTVASEEMGE